jgi:hypothetical protein
MTNDYIKEVTKDKSPQELMKVWYNDHVWESSFFQHGSKRSVIREELTSRKRMRSNKRGRMRATLHDIHSLKELVSNTLKNIFPNILIKEYHFDESAWHQRTNVHVFNVEADMPNGMVIKGDLIVDHYLEPISDKRLKIDKELGVKSEVTSVVTHEFVATLIDYSTAGARYFYVGNVSDFHDRVIRRAYAKHKNEYVEKVRTKFGF